MRAKSESRARIAGCAVTLLLLAALAAAAAPDAPVQPAVRGLPDCGSVVVVRCEPAQADRPPAPRNEAARRERERQFAARRAGSAQEFDRIIIEGEAIRRRTFDEAIAPAFPALKPVDGTTTTTIAESAQCTCMNRCPPLPFPCCQCSAHPSRYALSPGASPLR
jgi:hypothetical protein